MSDDALADLRVLVATVGGDVKTILSMLENQKERTEKNDRHLAAHDLEIQKIWAKLHRWAGAAAFFVTIFSSGLMYLVFMILHTH